MRGFQAHQDPIESLYETQIEVSFLDLWKNQFEDPELVISKGDDPDPLISHDLEFNLFHTRNRRYGATIRFNMLYSDSGINPNC